MAVDRLAGKKTLRVSGFLDEFEKDEVKKRVDIVSLFSSFGVKLTRKGKNYSGLCPWHDDKNPSLSVDRDKGLYNCFGCGESGDIFSLVEKMKSMSFPEALEYLKSWAGEIKAPSHQAKPAEKKKAAASDPEPSRTTPPASVSELTLATVAGYYHKRLYGNKEAVYYLEKRGLKHGELFKRFELGFADGSLLSRISNGQKEHLQSLGILKDNGKEHLHNCIIVPLQDEGGSTVGLYGRKITDKGRLKHLYLKGPHRGIFNRKASKAYDEVILCESVLDAISLIALGIENVQALYGTNGLTKEHLEVLKSDRVRMVILALDSDEAGKKASSALKEQLSEEGFTVKIIFPLKGKDWNDSLVSGSGREEIKALIEEAEESRPEMAGQPFEVSRVGPKHLFKISGIEYRVLGVKSIFVSSLRVNIQAEYQGMKFLDNVDLYSARSRSSFSCNLAHIFGLEVKRIDYDLLKMVEVLEEQRDRNIEEKSCGHESKELSEEERILGLELLQSPDLFKRITSDLEILGYVGEELNKQLIYLAASSRKMDDPISVLIISQSASGKSLLVDTVRRLIPQEDVVAVSSLSDQALNYLPEGGLLHKFLILGEAVHSEVVEHQIREMLSAHELSRLVTMKDPKTGELSTRTVSSPVLVSAVMSSTRHEINPENASRCFVVGSDESRGQTKKIHRSQKKKYSLGRHYEEKTQIPLIIKQHQAAQRLLQKCLIVNPYAEYLEFPDTLMRTRRDHERFIDLIAGVCFLRQFQKEEKEEKDQTAGQNLRYLECDLIDYEIAYRILIRILPATVSNFPRSAILLYESVRKLAVNKAAREKLRTEEVSFSQREIREQTDHNQMFVKRYLRVLVDYEYLHLSGSRHRGSRRSYRLVADEDIRFLDLSMIPTPEEMAGLFKASKPGE